MFVYYGVMSEYGGGGGSVDSETVLARMDMVYVMSARN